MPPIFIFESFKRLVPLGIIALASLSHRGFLECDGAGFLITLSPPEGEEHADLHTARDCSQRKDESSENLVQLVGGDYDTHASRWRGILLHQALSMTTVHSPSEVSTRTSRLPLILHQAFMSSQKAGSSQCTSRLSPRSKSLTLFHTSMRGAGHFIPLQLSVRLAKGSSSQCLGTVLQGRARLPGCSLHQLSLPMGNDTTNVEPLPSLLST